VQEIASGRRAVARPGLDATAFPYESEARYPLLETVRQYGREKLEE